MTPKTRLALLSTLAETHTQSIQYNLDALANLVETLNPDLLCVELPRPSWEAHDLTRASVEVRESLLPAAALTDVVILPVAPDTRQYVDFTPKQGWRGRFAQAMGRALIRAQRAANNVDAIHAMLYQNVCHTLCLTSEMFWTAEARREWHTQNEKLLKNILQAVQQDPGRRVLVALQCQCIHWLEPKLKEHPAITLVDFREL